MVDIKKKTVFLLMYDISQNECPPCFVSFVCLYPIPSVIMLMLSKSNLAAFLVDLRCLGSVLFVALFDVVVDDLTDDVELESLWENLSDNAETELCCCEGWTDSSDLPLSPSGNMNSTFDDWN